MPSTKFILSPSSSRCAAFRFGLPVLLVLLACSAGADLQNVEVGGVVRVRFRTFYNMFDVQSRTPGAVRIAPAFLPGRAIGPFGVTSRYDWNDRGNDRSFVEQSARLNVRAHFTQDLESFIELKSYDVWGSDFRSNPVTGADTSARSVDDLEIFQGYIQANEMFGLPLSARIGRQEMRMGKGWLIGSRSGLVDRSYDAIRLTYQQDPITVDAFASKLAEASSAEQDGDVALYGVYGNYAASKALNISLYWFLIRDAAAIRDTALGLLPEWLENQFGLDNYDPTRVNTVGARIWGKSGPWDYDLELAHQFGGAGAVGAGFRVGGYGDNRAEYDEYACDGEAGYRFDRAWTPRLFVGGAYFSGHDRRGLTFGEWLNPFHRPRASVSFNRMFPDLTYTELLDNHRTTSNFHQVRAGIEAKPLDRVTTTLTAAYYGVNERFDRPKSFTVGGLLIPIMPAWSFWTEPSGGDIGFLTDLSIKYEYSDNLSFRVVWQHLFTGAGVAEGNFIFRQGLEFSGGTDRDDADYFALDTSVAF